MGNLSKNFSSKEFVVSAKFPNIAKKTKIYLSDDYKFFLLANLLLQPIRDMIKMSLVITSGLCKLELNQALGRNPGTTDHDYGNHDGSSNAVDFIVVEGGHRFNKTKYCFDWAKENLQFGQLIWYPKRGSVHVTLMTPHHQNDVLIINN